MSNIDPTSNGYNQLFPVAGVNNSSQGYRNNFTSIYENFSTAKTELTKLQTTNIKLNGDVLCTMSFLDDATQNGTGWQLTSTATFNINPIFPGNAALTLVTGNTAQRPATPTNGMLRYNSQTNNLEAYINNSWLTFSNAAGSSSYVLRTGDTMTGCLTMNGGTTQAQIIGDTTQIIPSFTFNGDLGTGLTRTAAGNIALTSNNTNVIVASKNTNNTIANFSPNTTIVGAVATNTVDTTNTKIHGQFRGFQKSFEYFIFMENVASASMTGSVITGAWSNIVSFDATVETTSPSPLSAGFNFDFNIAGADRSQPMGFSISGVAIGSFMFDGQGNFITDPAKTPDPIDGSVYGYTPLVNIQTTAIGLTTDVNFRTVQQGSNIVFQIRLANTALMSFDVSGRLSIHFSSMGILPITPTHD